METNGKGLRPTTDLQRLTRSRSSYCTSYCASYCTSYVLYLHCFIWFVYSYLYIYTALHIYIYVYIYLMIYIYIYHAYAIISVLWTIFDALKNILFYLFFCLLQFTEIINIGIFYSSNSHQYFHASPFICDFSQCFSTHFW